MVLKAWPITKYELLKLIEESLQDLPERMSGNEANQIISDWLWPLAFTNRDTVIGALRDLLSFRVSPCQRVRFDAIAESRMWLALHVAEDLNLIELRPDIELLLVDVRAGKALHPIHEKSVAAYLKALSN
jgi:hypothetical protein